MIRSLTLPLATAALLLTLACAAAPTPQPPAPTPPPPAAPTATTAAPAPAAPPVATNTPAAAPALKPAATNTSAAAGAATKFTIGAGSAARFVATEQLVGRNLPNKAIGTTDRVTGAIVLGGNGAPIADQSKVTVDLSAIATDDRMRDNRVRNGTLEVSRFPNAVLAVTSVQGLPSPLPNDGEVTFTIVGDLTLKGVTKPTTWRVKATAGSTAVSGTASTSIKLEDYGMERPIVGPVLSIDEIIVLEIDFQASRAAA
ncbi:MAG: YceI family protein [Chloroflexi bacterium]|nr:YceI family protein [Chloroflexota bacterium]